MRGAYLTDDRPVMDGDRRYVWARMPTNAVAHIGQRDASGNWFVPLCGSRLNLVTASEGPFAPAGLASCQRCARKAGVA